MTPHTTALTEICDDMLIALHHMVQSRKGISEAAAVILTDRILDIRNQLSPPKKAAPEQTRKS